MNYTSANPRTVAKVKDMATKINESKIRKELETALKHLEKAQEQMDKNRDVHNFRQLKRIERAKLKINITIESYES